MLSIQDSMAVGKIVVDGSKHLHMNNKSDQGNMSSSKEALHLQLNKSKPH